MRLTASPFSSFKPRSGGGLGIVKRAAFRSVVEFEVVEQVVDDLPIIETHLRKLSPADFDDLVNMPDLPGIAIVQRRVVRLTLAWMWGRLRSTKRRLMSVVAHGMHRAR